MKIKQNDECIWWLASSMFRTQYQSAQGSNCQEYHDGEKDEEVGLTPNDVSLIRCIHFVYLLRFIGLLFIDWLPFKNVHKRFLAIENVECCCYQRVSMSKVISFNWPKHASSQVLLEHIICFLLNRVLVIVTNPLISAESVRNLLIVLPLSGPIVTYNLVVAQKPSLTCKCSSLS